MKKQNDLEARVAKLENICGHFAMAFIERSEIDRLDMLVDHSLQLYLHDLHDIVDELALAHDRAVLQKPSRRKE